MKAEIAEYCRRLRLGKNIALISDQIEAESHQEYLLKVLKEELAYRETKRKNRLIKQAGFYTLKTFEDYCFDEIKLPAELSVGDLKEATFISEKKNLILYGNVGTGKTHLATAIGVEAAILLNPYNFKIIKAADIRCCGYNLHFSVYSVGIYNYADVKIFGQFISLRQ